MISKSACSAIVMGIAIGVTSIAPPSAGAADCSDELRTENGVCQPIATAPNPASTTSLTIAIDREKLELADSITSQMRADAGQVTEQADAMLVPPKDPTPWPISYRLPEVTNMTIYKEGQGNGKKSFTCGPSTTRNMVAAMWKRRYGNYKDYGEHQFELWEGTTRDGTSTGAIANTLNAHFSSFGHWTTTRPTDKYNYMAWVVGNTNAFHQSIPVSVDTEYYPYFNGKALNHIDLLYGYDKSSDPWYVYVAEEWDPVYIYGYSSYGNPYGHRKVRNLYGYQAVTHTSYHRMVT